MYPIELKVTLFQNPFTNNNNKKVVSNVIMGKQMTDGSFLAAIQQKYAVTILTAMPSCSRG